MRPKHVAKYVRADGTCWYLMTLQNGTERFYRSTRALPRTVKEWLKWHSADGDTRPLNGGIIYHYWG